MFLNDEPVPVELPELPELPELTELPELLPHATILRTIATESSNTMSFFVKGIPLF